MRRTDAALIVAAVVALGGAVSFAAFGFSSTSPASEPVAVAAEPKPAPAPPVQPAPEPEPASAVVTDPAPPPRAPPPIKTAAEGTAEGSAEARADLARGVLGWRTLGGWGYPAPQTYTFVSMSDVLASDFGVAVKHHSGGAGCRPPVDEPYQRARLDAYNAVMTPALQRRHGANVLTVAQQRADARTAANRIAWERKGKPEPLQDPCLEPTYTDKHGIRRVKPQCF